MPTLRISEWLILSLAAIACGGCASYTFDVTPASDHAMLHVNSDEDTYLAMDPLRYQMRAVEGRLVMRIGNGSEEEIQLLGQESSVIDPDGVDHPLRDRTIEPVTSIKEVFPPLSPDESQSSPAPPPAAPGPFGPNDQPGILPPSNFGLSSSSSGQDEDSHGRYYWSWEDEGEIRVKLVYHQGQRTFRQDFVIRRIKK